LAGGEAVEDGVVVEEAGAGAFLDEVVVEVVHAAGVGAEEETVGGEVLPDRCLVDAVVEAGGFRGFGGGLEFAAGGLQGGAGGGFEWDDDGGEFAVEGDGAAGETDEGVDIAEVAAGEFGAVEDDGVGGRKGGGEELLFAGVGVFGEEGGGELFEALGGQGVGEDAAEFFEEDDGERGPADFGGGFGGERICGACECRGGGGEVFAEGFWVLAFLLGGG
jgi:hypothetical protein